MGIGSVNLKRTVGWGEDEEGARRHGIPPDAAGDPYRPLAGSRDQSVSCAWTPLTSDPRGPDHPRTCSPAAPRGLRRHGNRGWVTAAQPVTSPTRTHTVRTIALHYNYFADAFVRRDLRISAFSRHEDTNQKLQESSCEYTNKSNKETATSASF